MSSANDRQIGGSHYQRSGALQHWDLVCRYNVPYLEGCATKYLLRWRQKGGKQDIEKALHYTQKRMELIRLGQWGLMHPAMEPGVHVPDAAIDELLQIYDPGELEADIIRGLLTWSTLRDLEQAEEDIIDLLDCAQPQERTR